MLHNMGCVAMKFCIYKRQKNQSEVLILTPIPCGWMDRSSRSQKGCPYSLLFPTRPFLKSCKSHPRWPRLNTLLEKPTADRLPSTSSCPPKKHQILRKTDKTDYSILLVAILLRMKTVLHKLVLTKAGIFFETRKCRKTLHPFFFTIIT